VADAVARELAAPPTTTPGAADTSRGLIEQALMIPCEANWLQLVLVFGDQLTLAGFPPWLTHLCEILHAVRPIPSNPLGPCWLVVERQTVDDSVLRCAGSSDEEQPQGTSEVLQSVRPY
jgi:hypothetical protein